MIAPAVVRMGVAGAAIAAALGLHYLDLVGPLGAMILPAVVVGAGAALASAAPQWATPLWVALVAWVPIYWAVAPGALPFAVTPMVLGGIMLLPLALRGTYGSQMNAIDVLFSAYAAALLLSYWVHYDQPGALTVQLAVAVALPYFVCRRVFAEDHLLRRATLALCATAVGLAIIGIWQSQTGSNLFLTWRTPGYAAELWTKDVTRFGEVRASASFGQALVFGTFLAAVLVLLMPFLFGARGWRRALAWTAAIVIAWGVLATGSRGPVLMAFTGVALFIIGSRGKRIVRLVLTLVTTILVYLLTPAGDSVNRLLDSLSVGPDAANARFRLGLFRTLTDGNNFSLTGRGQGNLFSVVGGQGVNSIDSQYVLAYLQSGFLVLAAFLMLLVPTVKVALTHADAVRRAWACATIASFQGLATVALLLQQADVFWIGVAITGSSLAGLKRDVADGQSQPDEGHRAVRSRAGATPEPLVRGSVTE